MKLLLKQRAFSLLDSYDIYDDFGNVVFIVKGKFAMGHMLEVYTPSGLHVGTLKQKLMRFLPTFEIYINGQYMGCIKKDFTFFVPSFTLDFCGWKVDGNFMEWDYSVYDGMRTVMTVSKQLMRFSDTYVIEINNDENTLAGLMIALAIDAEKCSRD